MKRTAFLMLLLAALMVTSGCISPSHKYGYMADQRIQYCEGLLARNQKQNAPTAIRIYSDFLRTMPQAPGLLSIRRRVLLKRGEAYFLLGDKHRAETDFREAARIARTLSGRTTVGQPTTVKTGPASPGTARPGTAQRGAGKKAKALPPRKLVDARPELWLNGLGNWSILRDGGGGPGTSIHPLDDLDASLIMATFGVRARVGLFPRVSAGIDLAYGSVSGSTTIDEFMRYDGRILPLGEEVHSDFSFFDLAVTVGISQKLPVLGWFRLDMGAKYVSFDFDMSYESGGGFADSIDAFLPVVGVHHTRKLVKGLELVLDGRLCGLYWAPSNFAVSNFLLEIFGGVDLFLAPHVYLWGGIRYAYTRYEFTRDHQDKDLNYTQVGPAFGLRLKV